MFNIRDYLEEMQHILSMQSPAQFKMFIYRYMEGDSKGHRLLNLDRSELKLYMHQLKDEVLPWIEESLDTMSDDPLQ